MKTPHAHTTAYSSPEATKQPHEWTEAPQTSCNICAGKRLHTQNLTQFWARRSKQKYLLQQLALHLRPVVPATLVVVHSEQDADNARQALRLLLQQVRLGLALEACHKAWSHQQWWYHSGNRDESLPPHPPWKINKLSTHKKKTAPHQKLFWTFSFFFFNTLRPLEGVGGGGGGRPGGGGGGLFCRLRSKHTKGWKESLFNDTTQCAKIQVSLSPGVTLCVWQDIQIQLLTNSGKPLLFLFFQATEQLNDS